MRGTLDLQARSVGIYARFSSERQREASIDDQIRRCREYIVASGGDPDAATVFTDRAVSGASLDRPGFEALMAAVDAGRIDAIVTEDISRISRDLADSASVFKRLQFAQVPLIGVADGIDTSSRDAKLSFTLKSLVADIYLDDLRDKTLRGLEGRARAGYATGSTPYGYRSVPEMDPTGGIRGHRIEIDESQAAVVRRIFTLYSEGRSLAAVARQLVDEDIPSPRAGTRHTRARWGTSTIRAMLYNERYAGVWKYKETQWIKVPGTNKRRPRKRADGEVLRFERPDLRIIDADLWHRVQRRLQATRRKYTRNGDSGQPGKVERLRPSRYLLSGLLSCGVCQAPMIIVSGPSAAYYRCSNQRKTGECRNGLSVREESARADIVALLRDRLMTDEAMAYMRDRLTVRLAAMRRRFDDQIDVHRHRLADCETRIRRLVAFVARGDRSTYIASELRDLEARARAEKAAIAALQARKRRPPKLPSNDEIMHAAWDLDARLQEDLAAGREQLRQLLAGRPIEMIPANDERPVLRPRLHSPSSDP